MDRGAYWFHSKLLRHSRAIENDQIGDADGFGGAFSFNRHVIHDTQSAIARLRFNDRKSRSNATSDPQRSRKTYAIQADVQGFARSLHGDKPMPEHRYERKREISMRDRSAESACARPLNVEVNPLKISGALSERIHAVLFDGKPISRWYRNAHQRADAFEAMNDLRRHISTRFLRSCRTRPLPKPVEYG